MIGEIHMVSEVENCKETLEAGLYHVLIKVSDYNDVMGITFINWSVRCEVFQ